MITVLGSINLDLIGKVGRIPTPGETVPGSGFSTAPGGKGANQALAARRAGAKVRLIGAIGSDAFSLDALRLVSAGGVQLTRIKRADGATGVAMILVDSRGENVIAVLPGANGTLTPADGEDAVRSLGAGSTLLVQQEIPQEATLQALRTARSRGVRTILNTAPFLGSTASAAALAAIVVANESEFELLSGEDGPLGPRMEMWARQHAQTLIVTLGGSGAVAATPDGSFAVPALSIVPVDTVGAGDTFVGYLAAGLDAAMPLEAAMRRAAIAGSLACLKPGAQPAIPTADEVAAALA